MSSSWQPFKDNLLIKTKTEGNEEKPVKAGDTVLLNLIGRQADEKDHLDGTIFQKAESWLVPVGEPHCLVRAVEYALETMHAGQIIFVYVPGEARASLGMAGPRKWKDNFRLPADANLLFEIQVTQIVMDTSRLNPYFTIQKALTMKKIANDVYNNIIAVHLRAKHWNQARQAASVFLQEIDSKNPKAWLRRTKAYVMDPQLSNDEKEDALAKAEQRIVYKDPEEVELKLLRTKFQKERV